MREINPDRLRLAMSQNRSIMDIAKRFNRDPATVLRAIRDNGLVKRKCMGCGNTFVSSGPGNRFCTSCKRLDEWRGADENFTVANWRREAETQ